MSGLPHRAGRGSAGRLARIPGGDPAAKIPDDVLVLPAHNEPFVRGLHPDWIR
jgi:hypothetical protein